MSELFNTILDQEHVRSLLASIQQATGVPVSLLGDDGELLASAGWNDLCRLYHSQSDLGQEHCHNTRNYFSGAFIAAGARDELTPLEKQCQNGLIEVGLPIVIEGRHYATLVFGQFMPDNFERENFRQQALAMDVDTAAYLAAVDAAPVFDRAVVEKMLSVYSGVIDMLVRIGLQHIAQEQTTAAVRVSEQKFRALFDNSNDAIYIIDLDGAILEANQITCDRLGYSHAELCAMSVSDLGDASHMLEVDGRLKRFKKEGRLFFETNHRCKDSTLIPVEVNGKVIDYAGGEAILCTARDLRRRYAAQQALKQSEAQFRSIIDSSPMGVHLYRCDDDGRLLLVGSNPSADKILGIKMAELHGLTIEEAFPPLADTELPDTYRRVCRDGERWSCTDLQYEDGNVSGAFDVHAFQTAPNVMAVFFLDVTEREKLNRMKDEMLSAVSHEMRTPLTAILGYTELMLDNSLEPEQRQKFLKTTYREGERLRELVDDILDLQRFRAGFASNQMRDVDVVLLLHEVASLFNETAREHTIEVACAPALGMLTGDNRKIHRALKNLMTNAVKYSPDGGLIKLSAGLIDNGGSIRISVQDFGLGVPDDAREHLFDKFFRVCPPELKNLSGAGIGLSLVSEIAKMHGGSVWFDSVHGQGSTFNLELPVAGAMPLVPCKP